VPGTGRRAGIPAGGQGGAPGLDGVDLVAVPEEQHALTLHAHLLARACRGSDTERERERERETMRQSDARVGVAVRRVGARAGAGGGGGAGGGASLGAAEPLAGSPLGRSSGRITGTKPSDALWLASAAAAGRATHPSGSSAPEAPALRPPPGAFLTASLLGDDPVGRCLAPAGRRGLERPALDASCGRRPCRSAGRAGRAGSHGGGLDGRHCFRGG
jgi:hypothetical protein